MIYLGADHRGFSLKVKVKQWLADWGYEYIDMGNTELKLDDDYPDFAAAVAKAVILRQAQGQDSRGVLICGSGIGIAIAANKIKGIRAGTGTDPKQISAAVNDEDLNILAVPADYLSDDKSQEIIKVFLNAKFSGEERHLRRLKIIQAIENG